ncbi:hypothetical protein GGI21_003765, partial [Coemansia aciculifera]
FLVGRALASSRRDNSPPLGAEMPPVSPFFARIRPSDIDDVRETVRRASITRRRRSTRRNTLAAATSADDQLAAAGAVLGSIGRWSSFNPVNAERLFDSLNGGGADDGDWLLNQEPPISPLFADENRLAAAAAERHRRKSLLHTAASPSPSPAPAAAHWYQVNVHSLFSSPFAASSACRPRVDVKEIGDGGADERPVDLNDPDVRKALRRYPMVLAIGSRQQKQNTSQTPTRIRVPSQRKPSSTAPASTLPALSFTVSNKSSTGADRSVRAVDVEAMAAAYLPRVYAMLDNSGTPQLATDDCSRTPSQSSIVTLAESLRSEVPTEQQPKPRPLLRRQPRRSDIGPATATLVKLDAQSMTLPAAAPRQPQLRSSVSVMNLRSSFYADRSAASLLVPATPLSAGARRSTLATRAAPQPLPLGPPVSAAAGGGARRSIMRRNSAMELNVSRPQQPQLPPLPPPPSARRMQYQPPAPPLGSATETPMLKLRSSHSYATPAVETPTSQRSNTGLRTPTSLASLSSYTSRSQLPTGSVRSSGRLQHSGAADTMPLSTMMMMAPPPPMRSASLEISSSGHSTSRMSRIAAGSMTMETPLALRRPLVCPSTESSSSVFGRRRGTTTAVTPTAPRTIAAAMTATTTSRLLKLTKPFSANNPLANGPKSAPAHALVPEPSYLSLPPLPKRTPGRIRTDVRGMFGGFGGDDGSTRLLQLPTQSRLVSVPATGGAGGALVDMYRGPESALPVLRLGSKRMPSGM